MTDLIKNQVSRPRPDFFYRCYPDGNPPEGQPSFFELECTNPDLATIEEGRRSFPSGHSSFSFCLTIWLSLYMTAKLRYKIFTHLKSNLNPNQIYIQSMSDRRHNSSFVNKSFTIRSCPSHGFNPSCNRPNM